MDRTHRKIRKQHTETQKTGVVFSVGAETWGVGRKTCIIQGFPKLPSDFFKRFGFVLLLGATRGSSKIVLQRVIPTMAFQSFPCKHVQTPSYSRPIARLTALFYLNQSILWDSYPAKSRIHVIPPGTGCSLIFDQTNLIYMCIYIYILHILWHSF